MKITGILIIAVVIIALGVFDSVKFQNNIKALEEILKLISLFKNEISYKNSSYDELYASGEKENFKNIAFKNGEIFLSDELSKTVNREFYSFINKIGTTDCEGQKTICDSFYNGFLNELNQQRAKEKTKLQVNLSLSLLGALSVVIIFI